MVHYYRQHVVIIYVIQCHLTPPHPPPNKQVSVSNNTDFLLLLVQGFVSWWTCWLLPDWPKSYTHPHLWLGIGLLRQFWCPELLLQWQSSLESSKETFPAKGGPRTPDSCKCCQASGRLCWGQHYLILLHSSCQYHPWLKNYTFVVGIIMRH